MKIILNTHCTNPDFNGDCDYAVVDLSPALVEHIRHRIGLAGQAGQQDNDLYELYFWGGMADFYSYDLVEACEERVAQAAEATDPDQAAQDWLAGLDEKGHAMLPAGLDLSRHEPQRTECDQMIIRRSPPCPEPRFEIAWTTIPKHSDVYVTTSDLPLEAFEAYATSEPEAGT
jgi:hypothetical protein